MAGQERGSEVARDSQTGKVYTRDTANYGSSGKSIAHVVDDQKSQLQAAVERAKKRQATAMPTQADGESPAAYGERLRTWRQNQGK